MMKDPSGKYLLADGTHANPSDCETGPDGVLRHIYGMAVALREDGEPMTVGQGAVDNKNVEAAQAGVAAEAAADEQRAADAEVVAAEANAEPVVEPAPEPAPEPAADPGADVPPAPSPAREMQPEPAPKPVRKPGYKTRQTKAK